MDTFNISTIQKIVDRLEQEIYNLKKEVIKNNDELKHKDQLMEYTNTHLLDEIKGWKQENKELREIIRHLKEVK